ncbi:MAG: FAD-binding protein [Acidobacteria bacterium]|nr:FAD-binding protein [Acidobacteriota bacterium]MDA1235217.1 FAD-binding protein [Acidobacteriota bacterium]
MMHAPAGLAPTISEELKQVLGERLSVSRYDLESHGVDESYHPAAPPDAVAFIDSTEEAATVLKVCNGRGLPVIPFGTGTGVEGHTLAIHGGLSLDVSRLNRILEINPDDLDCRVQAGVTRMQLNRELEKHGLMFPVDPGADASLGGMAATGASGTTTVRYGTIRENVLGMTVALADGRVIKTGGRARKSSAGYDLTRLFIGSEGTLGVITEVQLRVYPLPEAIASAVCGFESVEGAATAVVEMLQSGVPVARCELLDEDSVKAVNAYAKLDVPVRPTVFFEFHGTHKAVQEQAEIAGGIVAEHGGSDFQWSPKREDREKLWDARHKAYFATKAIRPGTRVWATDVAVPISRLAECIQETRREIAAAGIMAPILGHIGDGNFHVLFILDEKQPEEITTAKRLNQNLLERALAMGGTCTGEHGVGLGKIKALREQHGEGVDVMRAIKDALDPKGIMNPGKIFG